MEKKLTIKTVLICALLVLSIAMFASCQKKVNTDPDADNQQTMTDDAADDSATDDTADDAAAAGVDTEENNEAGLAQLKDDFENVTIKFSYDSSAIMDMSIPVLEEKAEWLRNNTEATVTIQGHCDERGTTEYNLALGDRRAARVKSFLVNLGIDAERITTISYGEEKPAVSGNDEAAWAANRRANCVID